MKIDVFPSALSGTIRVPGSKSVAQRLVAAALLAKGETIIRDYPEGNDADAALRIAQELGAVVVKKGSVVHIQGGFPSAFLSGIRNPKTEIHCGESGLCSRMFTPIAALHNSAITIQGEGSLLKRPMPNVVEVMAKLGVRTISQDGFLPITVEGPLSGAEFTMNGKQSSQFLTGLLMALPKSVKDSVIHVDELRSRPYTTMTIEILRKFNINISHDDFKTFRIDGAQNYVAQEISVGGDWSGAAFLLVAGALCSDDGLEVTGISREITQGDSAIVELLRNCGVRVEEKNTSVKVFKSDINAFSFDATDRPDLFPPLAALAAFANGPCSLIGVNRLKHKESNRAKVLQEELAKAGVRIVLRDNEMIVYPGHLRPAVINPHNDHRIAMTAAILGLSGARMTVMNSQCIAKSYPGFYTDLASVGGKFPIAILP